MGVRLIRAQAGRWLVAACFALPAASAIAQPNRSVLEARLIHKPLYLRGFWKEDTLHFEPDGRFVGEHPTVSFTLAGMDATGIAIDKDTLTITGYRVALEFLPAGSTRILLGEVLTVIVNAPSNGDYGPALDTIFADGLPALASSLPEFWQPYMQKTFLWDATGKAAPAKPPATTPPPPPTGDDAPRQVGGNIIAPVPAKHPEVKYTDMARSLQYSGSVLLHVVVRKDGTVGDIHVARPVGLGLDEAAMAAVSHYTYKPAKENGAPVAVEMDVEVNCVAKPY
jgi:TonB family protein